MMTSVSDFKKKNESASTSKSDFKNHSCETNRNKKTELYNLSLSKDI